MVTPLTWTSYLDTMARLAVVAVDDENFLALAPQMVTYAELRMIRDLDFLENTAVSSDVVTAPGSRLISWPIEQFITVETVDIITPAGITNPDLGTRRPLLATTVEVITNIYPSASSAGVPKYFAMYNQNALMLGPFPDQAYSVGLFGTGRPDSLSATTPSTFISTQLPDLFIMASMIWISGYQRNFGRQSDDPQMAVSYEQQYMTLLKGAFVEEARKKFSSTGWTSVSPPVIAEGGKGAG